MNVNVVAPVLPSCFDTSLIALPVSFLLSNGQTLPLTLHVLWISAIWLGLALYSRRPVMFAAFQSALTLTVVLGMALRSPGVMVNPCVTSPAMARVPSGAAAVVPWALAGAALTTLNARQIVAATATRRT